MNDKLNQVLSKQKQQIDEPEIKNNEDIVQLVGFVVGEEEYAIPILNIQEIIKPIEYPVFLACLTMSLAYLTYVETLSRLLICENVFH